MINLFVNIDLTFTINVLSYEMNVKYSATSLVWQRYKMKLHSGAKFSGHLFILRKSTII